MASAARIEANRLNAEEHRAQERRGKGPSKAQRPQTRHDRPNHHARPAHEDPKQKIIGVGSVFVEN